MLREARDSCQKGQPLEMAMIPSLVESLLDPTLAAQEKADFLRALNQKGETENELAAFARALLPKAVPVTVHGVFQDRALFDCCGTGGGGLNIVNLSTAMMPVLAACHVPVVKHGNRGVTKKSGSADVLESLGVQLAVPPDKIEACLEDSGMIFLMAPHYHPAFKHVAEARKLLAAEGQRTIFNLLGPLLNPCLPQTQLLGVFQLQHLHLFQKALHSLERERFLVVCGLDADDQAMGEVSVTGANPAKGYLGKAHDEDLGLRRVLGTYQELAVTSKEESAGRIMAFLEGKEKGLLRHAILMNAAVAMFVHGSVHVVAEGYARAVEAVDSGQALQSLRRLITFTSSM
jgi:anthranilate phosphoribosyltransferase